jgi:hypothetical protein
MSLGFHRNIDVRMWGDRKFRQLSKPQPNAQTLWCYLLTGDHTGPVPGLFCVGAAALAEALEWPTEQLRERFAELTANGMAHADWGARVVYLPNAIRHNEPDNPNIVKGWFRYIEQVPECDLKTQAIHDLYAYLETRGEPFAKPFRERFGEQLAEPYPKQEREREKDLEKDLNPPLPPAAAGGPSPTGADGEPLTLEPPKPRRRAKRDRPPHPTIEAARACIVEMGGPDYPADGAVWDGLRTRIARGATGGDVLAYLRWCGDQPWERDTVCFDPSVLFREKRFEAGLAKARSPRRARDSPAPVSDFERQMFEKYGHLAGGQT